VRTRFPAWNAERYRYGTYDPDGGFVESGKTIARLVGIVRDPDRRGVVIASGDSGHAFKFAPVLGPLIADVVEGRDDPVQSRFAWRPGLIRTRWEEATRSQT
jgi:hypothetical protein